VFLQLLAKETGKVQADPIQPEQTVNVRIIQ